MNREQAIRIQWMMRLHAGHNPWGENDGSLRSTLHAWGLNPPDFLESLDSWGYEIRVRPTQADDPGRIGTEPAISGGWPLPRCRP